MKILAVSDVEVGLIYTPHIVDRFRGIDLAVSCGDLPCYYLEYIISMLDVPLYFVLGNHTIQAEEGMGEVRHQPWGAINLHRRILYRQGLLLGGMQGCLQYNKGPYQYTQGDMWMMVLLWLPRLLLNRLRYGRALDILISHAPPQGIHDQDDRAHQGFQALRWLVDVFQPALHLHGHVHVYRPDTIKETQVRRTRVINTFGYREVNLDRPLHSWAVDRFKSADD